jgi:hypothetical protein
MSVRSCYASGNAKDLVLTCVNDIKVMAGAKGFKLGAGSSGVMNGRNEVVIILHATGVVSLHEGWSVGADDVPELLAAKVLR